MRRFRVAAALLLGVAAVAFTAADATAGSADVFQQRGSLDGTFHDLNICSWPSTFTSKGQFYFEAVDTGNTFHFTYHETVNYMLVIDDDPSIPAAFRGVTWSGRNEETVVGNFDLTSDRGMFVSVNPFSEGPFHGLVERVTFVQSADGTVRIDRDVFTGNIDCDALTT
jgi:hypothetical protein